MPSLEAIRFAQEDDTRRAANGAQAAQAAMVRADELIADAPGRAAWACARGCAHCCHLQVFVTPAEAERIARLDATRERAARIKGNAAVARDLSPGEYRRARIRCAFLDDNDECAIYEARPLKCRMHTSTDVTACEALDRPVPMDSWLVRVGQALHAGLGEDETLELHAALEAYAP